MDFNINTRFNEPSDRNVSSLDGLYTDFDRWVARFNTVYKRSTYFSKEISSTEDCQNASRENRDNYFEKDFLYSDILLRQRRIQRPARMTSPPCFRFYKENDGFMFYDQIFYGILNKHDDRGILCQYVRSKL